MIKKAFWSAELNARGLSRIPSVAININVFAICFDFLTNFKGFWINVGIKEQPKVVTIMGIIR